MAVASFALTAGSEVAGAVGAAKAGKATTANALEGLRLNYNRINTRQVQETKATAQDINQAARQTGAAIGTARAGAGSAGVAGNSVDALIRDFQRDQADFTDSARANLDMTLDALQDDKLAARAEARSQIAGAPRPNIFASGLRIGAAGLDMADRIKRQSP